MKIPICPKCKSENTTIAQYSFKPNFYEKMGIKIYTFTCLDCNNLFNDEDIRIQ
jgi:hypothetical protein